MPALAFCVKLTTRLRISGALGRASGESGTASSVAASRCQRTEADDFGGGAVALFRARPQASSLRAGLGGEPQGVSLAAVNRGRAQIIAAIWATRALRSREQSPHDAPVNIGQAKVAALEFEGEALVIDAELLQ